MTLKAPSNAIDFAAYDVNGKHFRLSDNKKKVTVLSFFRDAPCPLSNVRIHEYTRKHREWADAGIEIICIFSSPSHKVKKFVERHPRPFRTFGDPQMDIYKKYCVEKSIWKFLLGIALHLPRFIKGCFIGGWFNLANPNIHLVPADFIILPNGKIVDAWYGRDISEHIPLKRIDKLATKLRQRKKIKRARKRFRDYISNQMMAHGRHADA